MPSWSATVASTVNSSDATGNVPYAAASERELAVVRFSGGTRFGTVASFAGEKKSVHISSANDAKTSPSTESTNGSEAITAARPTLQTTMTCLRSMRSMRNPAPAAKKKPGMMRAAITTPTDALALAAPTRVARITMARNPSQSPIAETTCASQRRKNSAEPNIRTWRPGRSSWVRRTRSDSVTTSAGSS